MSDTSTVSYEEMSREDLEALAERGAEAADVQHGYSDDDESSGRAKQHFAIFEVLKEHVASTKEERKDKAIERGALVQAVYPHTPGPGSDEYEDDLLVREVWRKLDQRVWNAAKADHTSGVQKLVGQLMPGYVLCRPTTPKLTLRGMKHETDTVYITREFKLIMLDFQGPLNSAHQKSGERLARNMAMVAERQRENAGRIQQSVKRASQQVLDHTESTLKTPLPVTVDDEDADTGAE